MKSSEADAGAGKTPSELLLELAKNIPLGRAGEPDDSVKAVLFLAADDPCYVNGAELFIDGGMVQI